MTGVGGERTLESLTLGILAFIDMGALGIWEVGRPKRKVTYAVISLAGGGSVYVAQGMVATFLCQEVLGWDGGAYG